MSQTTAIEWTDITWNPVHGCSKVSPGCAHCYAETLSRRYKQTLKPWTPENAAENVILKPHKLREPLSGGKLWREPKRVFVNSTSDLFHEEVPDEFIERVWDTMIRCPQHTFQVLTKRPERMRALLTEWMRVERTFSAPSHLPAPNVWLGVSIENRRYVHRADLLRETPAAVRFISAEPLLGPLTPLLPGSALDGEYIWWAPEPDHTISRPDPGLDLTGIDWVICGGESGPGHRPMQLSWVRSLLDHCLADRWVWDGDEIVGCRDAAPAFFFKQWGGATSKAGGRVLDGREWSEMPILEGTDASSSTYGTGAGTDTTQT